LEVRFRLEDSASVRVDGVDIWVRISDAVDTEFAVESVGTVGRAVYAAPSYLAAHGIPEQPEDLRTKDSVRYGAMPNPAQWVMSDGERTERIAISGRLAIDLGLALVEAVRAGAGVAVLPDFLAAQGVREGTLQRVLPAWSMSALTVFALVPPSSLDAPKTRAFCAFLREATLRRLK
jgi:DNA-binding transcriptional LysR family regulator